MEQQLKDILVQILAASQLAQTNLKAMEEKLKNIPAATDLSEEIQNAQSSLDVLNTINTDAQAILTPVETTEPGA